MTKYNADAIEVLTGLEPVRKRPGMYTDTTRPNHLAQDVIDNSVDEALAEEQAQHLYDKGAGQWGTQEDAFIELLCSR